MATQKFLNYAGLQHYNDKILEKVGNKELVHLIISYDSSLSGATITAKNGSEVHTATATTSGQTIISGVNLGTWTISENKQNTSAQVTAVYYGNYTATIGGDRFITVTYESAFEGKTITCTNGTVTQTRVASGGSVTFCFNANGTFTISATVSSVSYSTSVTVTGAGTYTANLVTTPDGETVTPVADVTTWLKCANLGAKGYTTLSQVLADNTTLLALLNNENADKYLVRSTAWAETLCNNQTFCLDIGTIDSAYNTLESNDTWYNAMWSSVYVESIANVKVPTMTSNTAPSGVANQSNYYSSSRMAYGAFDKNESTDWCSTSTPGWISYMFPNEISLKCLYIYNKWPTINLNRIKLLASNDNSSWEDLMDTYTLNSDDNYLILPIKTNNKKYKYFKIECSANGSSNIIIKEVQFYGRA